MRIMLFSTRIRCVASVLLMLVFTPGMFAQRSSRELASISCRRFAQQFYDWYAPLTQKDIPIPAYDMAIKKKPELFSAKLRKALLADWAAQSHASELVGLDFGPLVGSQDPADHYALRRPAVKNGICSVQLWPDSPTDNAAKSDRPDAVAELELQKGQWVFTNFRYPVIKGNLLQILAQLRYEREKFSSER